MSVRRSSVFGGSKRLLKEKIVQIYESFFRGEDLMRNNPNFWNEFFLLKPKVVLLETEILKLSVDELMNLKPNINILFAECVKTLDHEHAIRVVYALQCQVKIFTGSNDSAFYYLTRTVCSAIMDGIDAVPELRNLYPSRKTLCGLISSMCKKTSGECGFDVINILIGFDVAEQQMQCLLKHCTKFLVGDYPHSLISLCLKLLLVIVTGSDNISQNTLLEYLIMHSMFDVLVQLLCNPESRSIHGSDVLLLISLLVNYRKYELSNPYIVKLSILDNELALNGYGQVLTGALSELCHKSETEEVENQASWLSSITNMVGSMFTAEDEFSRMQQVNCNVGVLIALYEVVHLNRNFMTTLAHIQTDVKVGSFLQDDSDSGSEQSTLLVTFFQYCSVVMQDMKGMNNTKLCFIILSCIAEDQYANFYMHDSNLMFKVILYRLPMRHRKITLDSQPQTLAATLMDLLVEFIMSHMMNKFPLELYLLCIGVIHRILCYQKKSRVRLNYQWKNLWSALISLLKFLMLHKAQFAKKYDIFSLGSQVVNIFNLFIMYGDSFLPSPNSYDELYYEIIRMHSVFDTLYTFASRYSSTEGEFKSSAISLTNCLINVRAIVNHFAPKIASWLSDQSLSTPSEDQILEVVRKNYGSLTLKLQDGLDQYEPYSEKPNHTAFFTNMIRSVVIDTKQNIDYGSLDLQVILNDFSSIP